MNYLQYYDWLRIKVQSKISLFFFKTQYQSIFSLYKHAFYHKEGLEIGGPTMLFSTKLLPIYEWASQIDGCNFSSNTIWEGAIKNTEYSYHSKKLGKQFILEGTDLKGIADGSYDFLLSSHNLEHIANPLKAIQEWKRVLKPGGFLLLIVPDKNFTFDRKRNYTSFEHLLNDFEVNTGEDDLTHLTEILALHDFRLDPRAGQNFEKFKERGENNLTDRALHHHVFSQDVLKQLLGHLKFKTIDQGFIPPYNQIILGEKQG